MRELTTAEAMTLVTEGVEYAASIGRPSTIVVVDRGGHVRAALRPEQGRFANVEIARKKAWTAAAFQRPTDMVRSMTMPDAPGYGLQHTEPQICMVEGGSRSSTPTATSSEASVRAAGRGRRTPTAAPPG